jgi:hypothetical protein
MRVVQFMQSFKVIMTIPETEMAVDAPISAEAMDEVR